MGTIPALLARKRRPPIHQQQVPSWLRRRGRTGLALKLHNAQLLGNLAKGRRSPDRMMTFPCDATVRHAFAVLSLGDPVHHAAGRKRVRKAKVRREQRRTRMTRQYTANGNGLTKIYDVAQIELKR
jgi:hypothetical protein